MRVTIKERYAPGFGEGRQGMSGTTAQGRCFRASKFVLIRRLGRLLLLLLLPKLLLLPLAAFFVSWGDMACKTLFTWQSSLPQKQKHPIFHSSSLRTWDRAFPKAASVVLRQAQVFPLATQQPFPQREVWMLGCPKGPCLYKALPRCLLARVGEFPHQDELPDGKTLQTVGKSLIGKLL